MKDICSACKQEKEEEDLQLTSKDKEGKSLKICSSCQSYFQEAHDRLMEGKR
ncbi:MAG: hypothetical protein MUO26_00560 [Methanotrichaceae archaeon]|nr:hypothetical protein [Methanotrichaceae archaeon]